MDEIVRLRFRPADWNIYAAQASDGDNSTLDSDALSRLLTEEICRSLSFCLPRGRRGQRNTFDMPNSSLWTLYQRLRADGSPLSIRKVSERSENLCGISRSLPTSSKRGKSRAMTATARCLFEGADWDFQTLQGIHDACEEIARSELGLEVYRTKSSHHREQMLDAYSSIGMPLFYKHWSFGKHFAHQEAFYRKGLMGLAYEIVINSSPCISYLMRKIPRPCRPGDRPRGVRPQPFLQE